MDIFVKRPILALVVSLVLVLAGIYAAFKVSVLQFPEIESSSLVISTYYSGSSAEVIQGFITDPIERAAMSVPGIDYLDSTTVAGLSTVTAWLELDEDSTSALAELTSRINQIRYELPLGAEDPAIKVVRADRSAALFYLDVYSDKWSRSELTNFLQRQVSPQFSSIEGVQDVRFSGGRFPAMRIWLDPMKLAAVNLGANEVLTALQSNNVIAAIGKTENSQQQINLLTNATLETVDDFKRLVVRTTDNGILRVGDIARVELGEDRGSVDARNDNQQVLYISVWPLPGANEIAIGDELYKRLDKINAALPVGLKIHIGYDATVYMRNALKEIFITLIETVILVGLVVVALMGSFRTALVPLVTIPISILGAVAAMLVMGFTLNLLTVLAIVLSVGLVVDDAIVVVENVARHMRLGKSRFEAALISSRELLKPIIAMTFTLAAVYIPIGFVSGLTGSLFQEFTFTLAVAVVMSGIVAVTLSPIMSAYVISDRGSESKMTTKVNAGFDQLKQRYTALLEESFSWHKQILLLALFLSLLIAPLYLFSNKELAPVEDQSEISIIVEAPADSSLSYINGYMDKVIDLVSQMPGYIMSWQIVTADGAFGGLTFVDYDKREKSVHQMQSELFTELSGITGIKVLPVLESALPAAGWFDVELVVQSNDEYIEMQAFAQQLIQRAYQSGQFMYLDTDLEVNLPQTRIVFDRDRIADLGMDVQQVSQQLSALVSEQDINRFNADGKAYRVIPMVENYARDNPEAVLDLQIKIPSGQLIPVRSIAQLNIETAPRVLGKFNQQKAFRIFGGILPHTTNDAALQSLELAAAEILPADYVVDYAGVSRQLRNEGNSMISVLMISLAIVYLALVIQFNSLRLPLVVLLGSVPLALAGAMLFTFIGWTTINVYSQIGFITLVGLIAKNGILMTEFAHELQLKGIAKAQAITEATQIRLRPILMTTAATVFGHFPLLLVSGPGAEARNSIGIILVAGMAIGTFFTLFVLPHVYLAVAKETIDMLPETMVTDSQLAT
jgi:multidrug efflux pump